MGEPLSAIDAAWLQMDRPDNTADVVAVLGFSEPLPPGALREVIETRLLSRTPRLRERVVRRGLGGATWETAPRFTLREHLRHRRLRSGPGALEAFVGEVATAPLDLRRPPWQVWLADGHGPGSAAVVKLHHCIGDGFALVNLLLSLADGPRPAAPAPAAPHRIRAFRDLRLGTRPTEAIRAALRDPAAALRLLLDAGGFAAALGRMITLPSDPRTPLREALAGTRRVAWSGPLPLAGIRAAGRARGGTVNEVLIAALAGALRGALEARGAGPPPDVRGLLPVNLRALGDEIGLGNLFGLVFLALPLGTPSAEARVALVRQRMRALRESPDAVVTFTLLQALGRMPAALEQLANGFFTTKASLVITSVPGPRRPLRVAGRRVDQLMFWVPHPARLGLGVSILGYAGEVRVGVRADTALGLDPADLASRFEAELGGLTRATPAAAEAHRRPPIPPFSPGPRLELSP